MGGIRVLKVGIIGLGVISHTHIEAIMKMEDAEIMAVCDCNPDKKQNISGTRFYEKLDDILQKESLDCLHICLPHHLHVPAAIQAAKHGISIFMEKPAGLDSRDLKPLLSLEETYGVKLAICLQNRYNATTQAVKEILRRETYGKLKGCKAIVTWNRVHGYYNTDLWRGRLKEAGGGVMLSQAIHTLDLLCEFCGKIDWVKGFTGNLLLESIEVEDTACAHIQFQNGTGGIFYGSVTHCNDSSIEIEIVLEGAILRIRNNELRLLQNHEEVVLAADDLNSGKDYYGSSHYQAIRAFYDELMYGNGSYVGIRDTTQVIALIDGIIESSQKGHRIYFHEDAGRK